MEVTTFSVIVPCYNEEEAILTTITRLNDTLKDRSDYEIIVVNDGSTDDTPMLLQKAEQELSTLRVFKHERNRGYGAALKTGIRRARANLIVITDADGTYPNERIPELVTMAEDADMVVGARTASGEVTYPLIRKIPKWFLVRFSSWLSGQSIPDMNSGLRVFRKDIFEKYFNILPNGFSFTTTITIAMLTNHHSVLFIPIGYSSRIGKSKIKPFRDTLFFFQLILRTGMYFAPLRVLFPIITLLSLSFIASFVYDIYFHNLTEKTLILLMFTLNTGLFALLADMIDKRSSR